MLNTELIIKQFVCLFLCESKLSRTLCYTTNPFLTLLKLEWLQACRRSAPLGYLGHSLWGEQQQQQQPSMTMTHASLSCLSQSPAYSWQNLNTGLLQEGSDGMGRGSEPCKLQGGKSPHVKDTAAHMWNGYENTCGGHGNRKGNVGLHSYNTEAVET